MLFYVAIQSFSDKDTERYFLTGRLGKGIGWSDTRRLAMRKLDVLHYATRLNDLAAPPGNRLESLKGNLKGLHSIRINDQWRIIFRWTDNGPFEVRIADYH